jgi:perosamine synthetase
VAVPVFDSAGGRVSWFVFVVRLASSFTGQDRDWLLRFMASRGVGCGRYFAPLHRQPLYAACADRSQDLSVSEQVASRTLALPFFNRLTDAEIAEVCLTLREAIGSVHST